ncbi:tail fiber domain-containing protein [Patescibacteria group bacterium]|nr:tail fiber domain-containing protein [Patescibacteria group bacterium]
MNSELFFDNKKFISTKEVSTLTGYSQDYIGQLSRSKKVDSRRIGRVWYISEESILKYKNSPSDFGTTVQAVETEISRVVSSDIETSRSAEIAPVTIAISAGRFFQFMHELMLVLDVSFSRKVASFALGMILAIGAYSVGGQVLNLPKNLKDLGSLLPVVRQEIKNGSFAVNSLSNSISSLPQNLYDGADEISKLYGQKLSGLYISLGNSINNEAGLFSNDPSSYAFNKLGQFSLAVKNTTDNEINSFSKFISSSIGKVHVLASNLNREKIISKVSLTASVNQNAETNVFAAFTSFVYRSFSEILSSMSSFIFLFFNPTPPAVVVVNNEPVSSLPLPHPIVSAPSTSTPVVNQTINPTTIVHTTQVVERTVERAVPSDISSAEVNLRLSQLQNKIVSDMNLKFSTFSSGAGSPITNVYQQIAQSQKIDNIYNTAISNPTISGGSISGTAISATTLTAGATSLSSLSTPILNLPGVSLNSILYLDSTGNVSATSTPTFNNFNATSTVATSTISTGGLAVGTNQFVIQQSSGRIGIGTTSPSSVLELLQTTNGLPVISAYRNTDLAPTGDFINYKAKGGTTLFRVDNSGNLMAGGIVTSGSQTITSSSTPQFRVQYDASNEVTFSSANNGSTTISASGTNSSLNFANSVNQVNAFNFQTLSGVSVLNVDTVNKRVGVGTTSPYRTFAVNGAGVFTGDVTASSFTATSSFSTPTLSFNYSSSTIYSSFVTASTTSLIINGSSFNNLLGSGLLNTSNALTLDTTFLNNTTNSFIHASTTIPKTYSANIFTNSNTFSGPLTISSSAINSLLSTNASGVVTATSTPTFGNFNATSTVATSTISTGGFTVGTSQFVVQQSSGNVGVGTSNPLQALHVNTAGNFQLRLGSTVAVSSSYDIGRSTGTGALTFYGNQTGLASYDFGGIDGTLMSIAASTGATSIKGDLTLLTGSIAFTTGGTTLARNNGTGALNLNLQNIAAAGLTIISSHASTIPLAIKAAASQTSDLQQWQNSGGSPLSVITATGNLGIGTTTPLSKLAVSGGVSIGADYNIAAPTNGLIVEGNVGVGTSNPTTKLSVLIPGSGNILGLGANNTQDVLDLGYDGTNPFITGNFGSLNLQSTNGNIKLIPSSSSLVNIQGAAAQGAAGTQTFLQISRTTTPGVSFPQVASFGVGRYLSDGSSNSYSRLDINLKNISNSTETGDTTVMTMQSNGNIGIGTTSPSGLLDVNGKLVVSNSGFGTTTLSGLTISGSATSTSNVGLNLSGGCFAVNSACLGSFNNTLSNGGTATTTFYNGGIVFSDSTKLTQSSSPSNFFWDETNKRLGLGTSTPWGLLSVNPNAIGTAPEFVIGSSTSTHLIVTNGGNVGIGTTNPTAKLEVYGSQGGSYISYMENAGVYGLGIKTGGTTGSHQQIYVTKGDNTLNFGTYADGTGYLRAAAWTYGSDARMKENIEYLSSGLDKILALKPASFDYIDGSKNNLGFIAQDVQQVIPEAVVILPTSDMLGLKTEFIIPYVVEAIQELNYKIESLASSTPETGSLGERVITNLFTKITGWLASATNGIGDFFANRVRTKELCVSNDAGETCITRVQLDNLIANANSSQNNSTTTPTVDTSLPVITILGDNPASITVGTAYNDFGATVTDTNTDGSVNNNLGLHYTVDGVGVTSVSIDTTATSTHTVIYSAVDGAGNWGFATRTVEVQ